MKTSAAFALGLGLLASMSLGLASRVDDKDGKKADWQGRANVREGWVVPGAAPVVAQPAVEPEKKAPAAAALKSPAADKVSAVLRQEAAR